MRYVAGIAGICLLVVVVGLILMMKETASWQITTTYVTCLIVGAVLLLMAIKPRQVKANLGVNRGA